MFFSVQWVIALIISVVPGTTLIKRTVLICHSNLFDIDFALLANDNFSAIVAIVVVIIVFAAIIAFFEYTQEMIGFAQYMVS